MMVVVMLFILFLGGSFAVNLFFVGLQVDPTFYRKFNSLNLIAHFPTMELIKVFFFYI